MFGAGALKSNLVAARETRKKERAKQASGAITAEACETRFNVISKTAAIHFNTGSAELIDTSTPLLKSIVDIVLRCPTVNINVAGHTDSAGSSIKNQRLSELRARAVADYLIKMGVAASRIKASGYGESQPVVPNTTRANKAKNRRIEFSAG